MSYISTQFGLVTVIIKIDLPKNFLDKLGEILYNSIKASAGLLS